MPTCVNNFTNDIWKWEQQLTKSLTIANTNQKWTIFLFSFKNFRIIICKLKINYALFSKIWESATYNWLCLTFVKVWHISNVLHLPLKKWPIICSLLYIGHVNMYTKNYGVITYKGDPSTSLVAWGLLPSLQWRKILLFSRTLLLQIQCAYSVFFTQKYLDTTQMGSLIIEYED